MVVVINSRCNAEKRLSAMYLNIMGLKGLRLTTPHATSTTVPDCCRVCVCVLLLTTLQLVVLAAGVVAGALRVALTNTAASKGFVTATTTGLG